MAFSRLRPQYFAEIMANVLFWLGPDKLCFGSDYAIWSPKWLIEKFMAFELPEDPETRVPRGSDRRYQAEDLGRKCRPPVRDRHPGTDGQAQPGRDRPRKVIRHCRPGEAIRGPSRSSTALDPEPAAQTDPHRTFEQAKQIIKDVPNPAVSDCSAPISGKLVRT